MIEGKVTWLCYDQEAILEWNGGISCAKLGHCQSTISIVGVNKNSEIGLRTINTLTIPLTSESARENFLPGGRVHVASHLAEADGGVGSNPGLLVAEQTRKVFHDHALVLENNQKRE